MIRRTIRQIVQMTDGVLDESKWDSLPVTGVSTDTRTIQPGNLFIPIKRKQNGHLYVEEAFRKGASASLWCKDEPHPPQQVPLIFVDNPLSALHRLASRYRAELKVRVIGVTGSNGKTTTKDMIASIFARCCRVCKTEGNLNNHYGLPLTLLQMEEDTQIAVVEMGMSDTGEIALLSNIAQPDIAVITMIGESHLGTLGTREAIAAAKLEITEALSSNGVLFINGDEPLLAEGLAKLNLPETVRVLRFGFSSDNDYSLSSIQIGHQATEFSVNGRKELHYKVPLPGKHYACNALAAIAAAEWSGISSADIRQGLASVRPTGMRMEIKRSPAGFTVINDAFNASPSSVKAAIEVLCEMSGFTRKKLVLGDMLELGTEEELLHREIGRLLSPEAIDSVYTYGKLAGYIAEEAKLTFGPHRVHSFTDKASLADQLLSEAGNGTAILVKGSRGAGLEDIVERLLDGAS